jgi:hypothetical protein
MRDTARGTRLAGVLAMPKTIRFSLGLTLLLPLLGACSSSVKALSNPGSGDAGNEENGSGGKAANGGSASDCAGLGCPTCDRDNSDSTNGTDEICIAPGKTCSASSDCPATIAGSCAGSTDASCKLTPTGTCSLTLGTYTQDFLSPQCLSGLCAYQVVTASCEDATSCDDCSATGKAQHCAFKPTAAACATCCETLAYAGSDYASHFTSCACGANGPCTMECASSPLCGGAGPETDACATCLAKSLREGGACVKSAAFQDACIQHPKDGGAYCKNMAQCLATCPGT